MGSILGGFMGGLFSWWVVWGLFAMVCNILDCSRVVVCEKLWLSQFIYKHRTYQLLMNRLESLRSTANRATLPPE